jgi:hypothetical protein
MADKDSTPTRGADEDRGVVFPEVDGRRSTTATGKAVFAAAARPVDPGLADEIEAETDWRSAYLGYARRLLEARMRSATHSLAVPTAGLDALHDRFAFARGGETMPLAQAVSAAAGPPLRTQVVTGRGSAPGDFSVPYRGGRLHGDALHRQLDTWLEAGIAEPSFAEAIRLVMANPDWLDLSDQQVVILGAGAEMGPLVSLARWGAHVVPLDLPHPEVWGRILQRVREGRGRASVPVRTALPDDIDDDAIADAAGANLVTDLPEIAAWLDELDGPFTLGNYVYADGATHVRVSMAVDALTVHLAERHDDLALAVLATPTDVFAVPADAVAMSQRRFGKGGLGGRLGAIARTSTGGRLFAPNYAELITTEEGLRFGIADALVPQQGPNYALAKRLQRWRASVARSDGHVVSVNVAPPTRTRSVLKNRVLAAAYAGARRFGVEVFDPSTSNTLMAALLVHDLRNPKAVANPGTPLEHPLDLFIQGANPGGMWRNPYAPRSVLGLAVVLGMVQRGA